MLSSVILMFLFSSLLQTPAEQARARLQLVLQAAGQWLIQVQSLHTSAHIITSSNLHSNTFVLFGNLADAINSSDLQ